MQLAAPDTAYGAVLLIIGFAIGTWLRFGPGKQVSAMADAMLGTAEIKDRSGKVSQPAQPGLVHRTMTLEESVKALIDMVADQHTTNARLDSVEIEMVAVRTDMTRIHRRVNVLEGASYEKAASHIESAAMFDMVAKRDSDVIDGEVD